MKKVLAIVILIACMIAFVGCSVDEGIVQYGIRIEPSEEIRIEYSEKSIEAMRQSLYDFIYALIAVRASTVSNATKANIEIVARDICDILTDVGLNEAQFDKVCALVADIAEVDLNYDVSFFAETYTRLVKDTSITICGELCYRLLLYRYDNKISKLQERYDKYGYQYILRDIEQLKDDKKLIEDGLTPSQFTTILNVVAILSTVKGFESKTENADFLTDEEIVLIVKEQDLASFSLESAVWFELIKTFTEQVSGIWSQYFDKALSNGDINGLSLMMNDVFLFASEVQSKLTATDVVVIRNGRSAIATALGIVDDELLEKYFKAYRAGWHFGDYDALARKAYGEDFDNFVASTETYSLEELREASSGEDEKQKLKGFLKGISAAFAYEVYK